MSIEAIPQNIKSYTQLDGFIELSLIIKAKYVRVPLWQNHYILLSTDDDVLSNIRYQLITKILLKYFNFKKLFKVKLMQIRKS